MVTGKRFTAAVLVPAFLFVAAAAQAQVGEPKGAGVGNTFGIRITHGGNVLVDNPAVPFPADIKLNDGDGEDFVTIGSLGSGAPIILKIVSDGGPSEDFRITHWYVDAPFEDEFGNIDVFTPGPMSLFDPSEGGKISVEITNIAFTGTLTATPLVVGNDSFAVSYFLTQGPGTSLYYQTPNTNAYNQFGFGNTDIQVPGMFYLDGNASEYVFNASPGGVVSWSWEQIIGPTVDTLAVATDGSTFDPDGHVFELGLGVAFVGEPIPEPGTLLLLTSGIALGIRRRGLLR